MIECPNCWEKNEKGSQICKSCGSSLNDQNSYTYDKDETANNIAYTSNKIIISPERAKKLLKGVFIVFSLPFLLVGLALIGIGTHNGINEYYKSKDYVETTINFKDHKMCYEGYNDTICGEIYQYEVNGVFYDVSLDYDDQADLGNFNTIYYDPKNPETNVFSIDYISWFSMALIGLVIVIMEGSSFMLISRKLNNQIKIS